MSMQEMKFNCHIVEPLFQPSVRNLCFRPYQNHPNGCPNYGKRCTCPPDAELLPNVFNCVEDVWFLWAEFDIGAHMRRLQVAHPLWSKRQLACCLYWQGTVRKFLRQEEEKWVEGYKMNHPRVADRLLISECPEAMGVNVTATMQEYAGVKLEWPPKHITRMVHIMGVAK